ncbi:MAG TPA: transposase [Gemmatimonadales bacterium]
MRDYRHNDHRRRSIRLSGYDYARPGAYFVTACTQNRTCLFGDVVAGEMRLNDVGQVATQCWLAIPDHFPNVTLDSFVIMPNHVHGIIWIVGAVGAVGAENFPPLQPPPQPPLQPPRPGPSTFRSPSKTVGSIIRGFKIGVTKWVRANTHLRDVWQRNYYEHIIRDEAALRRIRRYIEHNPARWTEDSDNPARRSHNGEAEG